MSNLSMFLFLALARLVTLLFYEPNITPFKVLAAIYPFKVISQEAVLVRDCNNPIIRGHSSRNNHSYCDHACSQFLNTSTSKQHVECSKEGHCLCRCSDKVPNALLPPFCPSRDGQVDPDPSISTSCKLMCSTICTRGEGWICGESQNDCSNQTLTTSAPGPTTTSTTSSTILTTPRPTTTTEPMPVTTTPIPSSTTTTLPSSTTTTSPPSTTTTTSTKTTTSPSVAIITPFKILYNVFSKLCWYSM